MDDTTRRLVDLICSLFGIGRDEFLTIVREEAEAAGLSIREEVLAQC